MTTPRELALDAAKQAINADEASLIPPAERRAHYLGEISVTVENRLRAMGHAAAADSIVGIMSDLARQEASR